MTQNNNILQELKELNSSLAAIASQNVYSVPDGYFEGLIAQVMGRIKALESVNASDELGHLSPVLKGLSKQTPYSVPAGYFEGLAEKALLVAKNEQATVDEELASIAPFLSGLKKENPYTVPQGYFEQLANGIGMEENKPAAKVISITHRKWFRYAAAAVVAGVIVIAGLSYLGFRNRVDPAVQPYVWVKKNIKKVDNETIDAFVKLVDENVPTKEVASIPVKPEEIKELMKDVSDQEIQDFLDATPETENTDEATMMN